MPATIVDLGLAEILILTLPLSDARRALRAGARGRRLRQPRGAVRVASRDGHRLVLASSPTAIVIELARFPAVAVGAQSAPRRLRRLRLSFPPSLLSSLLSAEAAYHRCFFLFLLFSLFFFPLLFFFFFLLSLLSLFFLLFLSFSLLFLSSFLSFFSLFFSFLSFFFLYFFFFSLFFYLSRAFWFVMV